MTLRAPVRWIAAACIAAPLAASADTIPPRNAIDLPPYASPCEEVAGGDAIGSVSALTGAATHATPGCEPLPLACDARLGAGTRLATAAGGQVALNAGGAWVQLGPDSAATLRRDADGTLVLDLERGHARAMRLGDGEVPRIETPHVAAVAAGDDVVARVGEDASSLCSWADPLDVRNKATGQVTQAATGECSTPGVLVASIGVSTADVAHCDVAVGNLDPFDVASGPLVPLPPQFPTPPLPPPICTSGSCTGPPPGPPPPAPPRIPVIEQPGGFEPPP